MARDSRKSEHWSFDPDTGRWVRTPRRRATGLSSIQVTLVGALATIVGTLVGVAATSAFGLYQATVEQNAQDLRFFQERRLLLYARTLALANDALNELYQYEQEERPLDTEPLVRHSRGTSDSSYTAEIGMIESARVSSRRLAYKTCVSTMARIHMAKEQARLEGRTFEFPLPASDLFGPADEPCGYMKQALAEQMRQDLFGEFDDNTSEYMNSSIRAALQLKATMMKRLDAEIGESSEPLSRADRPNSQQPDT